jgi:hypothetical protein
MKALKTFTVLCLILIFPSNIVYSQCDKGTQQSYHEFTPAEVPCLTETVSGVFTELQTFSDFACHVMVRRGIATGKVSGEEYMVYNGNGALVLDGGVTKFKCR